MPGILLVTEDNVIANTLGMALVQSGYGIARARDGEEALRRYDPETVEVVVTELVMQGMEGMELIRKLRKLYPPVKIIAMSGSGRGNTEIFLQVARHLGASHTLAKPFTPGQLLTTIAACLNQSR